MKTKILIALILFARGIFAQTFSEDPNSFITRGSSTKISFVDVNNDNALDVFITGILDATNVFRSHLYLNEGDGSFRFVKNSSIEGVSSSHDFADIDNDGDQDLLITGRINSSTSTIVAKLYTNDGNGIFSEVLNHPFEGVIRGSIKFGDLDGDNDQDVIISGSADGSLLIITKTYSNDGNGNFSENLTTTFERLHHSSVDFADIDGDNDLDIIISGETALTADGHTELYRNDGGLHFVNILETPFVDLRDGHTKFVDIDNDDDQDLILIGHTGSWLDFVTKLYLNDGNGNYSEAPSFFTSAYLGSPSFIVTDFDNDYDMDIVITGQRGFPDRIIELYQNDGNGIFTQINDISPFEGIVGTISAADIDGDQDDDILTIGVTTNFEWIAKLYINEGAPFPTSVIDKVDIDADTKYSLYPNPIVGSKNLLVNIQSEIPQNIQISLLDINGKILYQEKEQHVKGNVPLLFDFSTLTKGVYLVKINDIQYSTATYLKLLVY